MSLPVVAGGIIAFKKLIDNITNDLYDNFKEDYTDKLKRIEALRNIDSLYNKIDEVSKVKTFWQTEKPVSISSFYCKTYIKYGNIRETINTLSDIKVEGNLLFEGIAGQGKSIFMRYLCIKELEAGKVIPVFMELRRMSEGDKLKDLLYLKLRELGFDIDDTIFKFLCSNSNIVFLLDGFDEVPDRMNLPLINEIEEITSAYGGIRIIISSRPDSGIEFLSTFSVIKLDHVRNNEYKEIVNKLSEDPQASKSLIEQVDNHKSNIKELLCTPLMITLLVLTYKAYQKVPEQLSDFFETMFHLLLQRHDGTKPGFRREKKCNLNDMEYQKIFEALCYFIKDKGQSYKLPLLYSIADKAVKNTNIDVDPQKFISDINKITCLLLYEGKEYRFLHKSIQEYFAASFIKYKPESVAIKFYTNLIADGYKWEQEILFMEDIDKYRFYKYYYIPLSKNILNMQSKQILKKAKIKYIENIIKNTDVYKFDGELKFYYGHSGKLRGLLLTSKIRDDARAILIHNLYETNNFYKYTDSIIEVMSEIAIKSNVKVASLYDIYTRNICQSVIFEYAEKIYDAIQLKALEVQLY